MQQSEDRERSRVPGPLRVTGIIRKWRRTIDDGEGRRVALAYGGRHDGEAIARRIAACWNACEGVPTEILERGRVFAAHLELNSLEEAYGDAIAALANAMGAVRGMGRARS